MSFLPPFSRPGLLLLLGLSACAGGPPPRDGTPLGADPVAYRMVEHPASGVEMPRISLPGRPEVEQRVNDQLDALAADLRCEDPDEGWYETSPSVAYAAHDVFSVLVSSNFYCGGAHPMNDADSSKTFDLGTGEAVAFRALFADYPRDAVEITRAYVENLPVQELEGCEDVLTVEALEGEFFAYTVATDGVRIRTSFPHVLEACNRPATVPFDQLRSYAAPGGILARLADAAGRD